MNHSIVLGVDIGGSHITAALVNLETRSVLNKSHVRKQVNSLGSLEEILSEWTGVMQQVFKQHPELIKRIGIAMPGPFDYEEGISLMQNQNKYDALYGKNIKTLLAAHLDTEAGNIRFINDAEGFLQGEVFCGAVHGVERAIGLTLGTGLGSAIYSEGACRDANLWCSRFLDGIAEDFLSARWFISRYRELAGYGAGDVREIAGLAMEDRKARQVFDEFGANLARFLSGFIISHKPQAVVLGGNIANAYNLFREPLLKQLSVFPSEVTLHRSTLGEEACLIGSASCWFKEMQEPVGIK